MGRVGGEDRGGQRRGRGLALRAGHPDRRGLAQAQEEVGLGHEGRRAGITAGTRRDEGDQGLAQARLRRRVVRVDRRRRRDERGVRPGAGRVHLRPERQGHVPAVECRDRIGELRGRSPVVHGDARSSVGQEASQGDAAAGQAQHGHRGRAQQAVPDRRHREGVRFDRAGRHRHAARHVSRSGWSVARNSVTPSRAARIPTIQKRMVIFSSSQPPSSKWWWIGLIRNSRLPPLIRK